MTGDIEFCCTGDEIHNGALPVAHSLHEIVRILAHLTRRTNAERTISIHEFNQQPLAINITGRPVDGQIIVHVKRIPRTAVERQALQGRGTVAFLGPGFDGVRGNGEENDGDKEKRHDFDPSIGSYVSFGVGLHWVHSSPISLSKHSAV